MAKIFAYAEVPRNIRNRSASATVMIERDLRKQERTTQPVRLFLLLIRVIGE